MVPGESPILSQHFWLYWLFCFVLRPKASRLGPPSYAICITIVPCSIPMPGEPQPTPLSLALPIPFYISHPSISSCPPLLSPPLYIITHTPPTFLWSPAPQFVFYLNPPPPHFAFLTLFIALFLLLFPCPIILHNATLFSKHPTLWMVYSIPHSYLAPPTHIFGFLILFIVLPLHIEPSPIIIHLYPEFFKAPDHLDIPFYPPTWPCPPVPHFRFFSEQFMDDFCIHFYYTSSVYVHKLLVAMNSNCLTPFWGCNKLPGQRKCILDYLGNWHLKKHTNIHTYPLIHTQGMLYVTFSLGRPCGSLLQPAIDSRQWVHSHRWDWSVIRRQ